MAGTERDRVIGQNLATMRGGWSQQALADSMRSRGHRWSQSTVWSIEKGDRPLKLDEAIDLASILIAPIERFWRPPMEVSIDRMIHKRFLAADDAMVELQDAAVAFEHELRVLRNHLAYAAEHGVNAELSDVFDTYLPNTAAEAVAPERLGDAWLRLGGNEGIAIPDLGVREVGDGEHQEAP